jgi:phosphocarrier protein HPr
MPSKIVTLRNGSGLHARPARVFAKKAKSFACGVQVRKVMASDSELGGGDRQGGEPVNAKSALSVLTLDCHQGDRIEVITSGDGADQALNELVELVDSGLGEGEPSEPAVGDRTGEDT